MNEPDDFQPKCYDCERELTRRALQTCEVIITHDEGLGYDEVPVPLCSACIGTRFGYDCPQCGCTHDDRESATYCCRRRPGEAPDCPKCDRRMRVESGDYSPTTGHTADWATCECCPIGWGSFTGWHVLDEDACKHIDADHKSGRCVVCGKTFVFMEQNEYNSAVAHHIATTHRDKPPDTELVVPL